jgi:hypothetical protein
MRPFLLPTFLSGKSPRILSAKISHPNPASCTQDPFCLNPIPEIEVKSSIIAVGFKNAPP